ncbi:hypothetical protein [Flammeovirga sp. SJP92]|uniref:hypothetical protein n=1 Tax=Flammeovirga sp. SJP92 TaxID=1775430 RepID=UPI000786CD1B|nr:hypothetical protein [Flammeovirga sp. SJP92]KXX71219.1 hypothetical protein AVL50_09185 [Flammeovirga sp. SJP92]
MKAKFVKYSPYFYFLLVVIFVFALFYQHNTSKDELLIIGDDAICTITETDPSIKIKYQVNGVDYFDFIDENVEGCQQGESFHIRYDKDNPENYKVLLSKPVFNFNHFGKTQTTDITKKLLNYKKISFSYVVNGIQYKRDQYLPIGFDSDIMAKAEVRFDVENPRIAYVILSN